MLNFTKIKIILIYFIFIFLSFFALLNIISDNDFFVEPNLWTGIGLARSGCGAAIVGNPDQVYEKIKSYIELGIKSFIFSGYPHHEEARYFAKLVLPRLKTISLPEVRNRIPRGTPKTPLGDGPRF